MKKLVFLIIFITFTSCSPNVKNHGYVVKPDAEKQITPGKTNEKQLLGLLGSPSAKSDFSAKNTGNTWYYISKTTESTAFFEPELKKQRILAIHFNQNKIVSKVNVVSEDQARKIKFAKDITPTEGTKLGFFEQVIGNLGRFNPSDNNNRNRF